MVTYKQERRVKYLHLLQIIIFSVFQKKLLLLQKALRVCKTLVLFVL